MSRANRRIKRKEKRKAKAGAETRLIERLNGLIRPYGGRISGVGPNAVGVQGDARSYGITVVVRFPGTFEQAAAISTHITNHVREVTRVLMEVV
jgi:GMP synthase PP-ATPase subunit